MAAVAEFPDLRTESEARAARIGNLTDLAERYQAALARELEAEAALVRAQTEADAARADLLAAFTP